MTEAERKEFQDTVSRFKTLREQADLEAKNGGVSQETKSQLNNVDDRIS